MRESTNKRERINRTKRLQALSLSAVLAVPCSPGNLVYAQESNQISEDIMRLQIPGKGF